MTAGELIWGAIVLYLMVMLVAMFITAFGDVLRRGDLSGWRKALWILVFFARPFVGVAIYLIVRPKSADQGATARSQTMGAYPSDHIPPMGMRP